MAVLALLPGARLSIPIIAGCWYALGSADSRYPVSPGIINPVSGTNQRYQPAALIGSFGPPAPSGRLREARVAVRRKATGAVDNGFALLIAHPDDRDGLATLPDHRDLRINTFGPYRNRTSVGLLDYPPLRSRPLV